MELDVLREALAPRDDGGLDGRAAAFTKEALLARGLSQRELDELLVKLRPAGETPDFELDLTQAKSAEHFAERFAAAVPKADQPPPEG
jgi:hypothetical protein